MSKRIVILGAGESGVGSALLAKAKGFEVFVSDMGMLQDKYKHILQNEKIPFEEGMHTESLILNATEVVKSPGIPDKAPLVKKLHEQNTPVISEIEFAARYTKAKFVAITGSNGKTTTTLLTYHLLKKLGLNVGLAGNIGESLAKQVIEDKHEYYVLELSSFQLDGMTDFKAHVAILLNITPDHLDRYEYKFENYIASKFRIMQNMTAADYFICFVDSEPVAAELIKRKTDSRVLAISVEDKVEDGAYLNGDKLIFNLKEKQFSIADDKLPLSGKHNMINTMAAVLAAKALGLDEQRFVGAMADFKNASHRLEDAGELNKIRFVNDSKATNVDSVWYALDSFKEPIVLIAGGLDKGNDYSQIEKLVKEKVKALVCMGKDNAKLMEYFSGKVPVILDTHSITDAVQAAYKKAQPGDVVLLSPACASFDLFRNYEDRGEQFKSQVKQLIAEAK